MESYKVRMEVFVKSHQTYDPIDKFLLWLLAICLGCKDLLPDLGISVLPFLVIIFLIPCYIIFRDIIHQGIPVRLLWGMLLVVGFYVAIIPINLNGLKLFLPLFMAAVAFRNLDINFIAKSFFVMSVIIIFIRFILIINDILEEGYLYTDKIARGISYNLGYENPNTPGINIFISLCCLYLLMYDRYKWLSFFIVLAVSVISFEYTASRTSLFSCLLLVSTYFVPKNILKRYVYNRIILCMIPAVSIAFIFLTEYLMTGYGEINVLMSGRAHYIGILMSMFSSPVVLLTGLQSDLVGDVDFPVDNGIAYLLCVGGIVAVGVFVFRYLLLVKNKELIPSSMLAVILVIFISGIGERTFASFGTAGASLFWILLFNTSYMSRGLDKVKE